MPSAKINSYKPVLIRTMPIWIELRGVRAACHRLGCVQRLRFEFVTR
jgi:hypothetical protein